MFLRILTVSTKSSGNALQKRKIWIRVWKRLMDIDCQETLERCTEGCVCVCVCVCVRVHTGRGDFGKDREVEIVSAV